MLIFIKKVAGLQTKDDEENLVIPDNPDDDDEWISEHTLINLVTDFKFQLN